MRKAIAVWIAAGACLYGADPITMTVARLYDAQLKNTEAEIVGLAEAMPAGKFRFKPEGGRFENVRTFAEQVKHVAAVNYLVSAMVLEEKPPLDLGQGESGPDDIQGKEAVVKFLKDSFAYAHRAMLSLTEKNQLDMVKAPWGSQKVARAGLANTAIWHPFDHYGQMVVYARMNGVVPPASQ